MFIRAKTARHNQEKVIVSGAILKRAEGIADSLGCIACLRGVGNAVEKAHRGG